jgi:hypothetical protein
MVHKLITLAQLSYETEVKKLGGIRDVNVIALFITKLISMYCGPRQATKNTEFPRPELSF